MSTEKEKARSRAYYARHKEKIKAYHNARREKYQAYYKQNRGRILARAKAYYQANPEKAREKERSLRLAKNLRARMRRTLKRGSKVASTLELLGCSIPEWRAHLESLFLPGMTWENYGTAWHVDHRKPCASFDLTDPSQQRICFHWSNTQPLFAVDNLRKSNKICA